ncbi:DUF4870 domain-containing protein [Deinococcus sp. VB343]|uniref:DUF4870 domain-containing protein n=1 Tax=Deinococcus sp. VB142 TaxID=3112952 RepID=A0AAU6Q059_9DEIO
MNGQTPTQLRPLASGLSPDERSGAYLLHLSPLLGLLLPSIGHLLGPVAAWWMLRSSPALDAQGKEIVNFQLTVTLISLLLSTLAFFLISAGVLGGLAGIVAPLAGALSIFGAVGAFFAILLPLSLLFSVYPLVCMVLGLMRAGEGQLYRYPLTIRFLS